MSAPPFFPGRRATASLASTRRSIRALGRAGMLRPTNMLSSGAGLVRWGPSMASIYEASRLSRPYALAVIDDWGACTFDDLHTNSDALAAGLRSSGLGPDDRIGILCRNSRGFVIAALAVAKLGADVVYLNTAAAGPQLRTSLETEGISFVIHDDEFAVDGVPTVAVVPHRGSSWWFPSIDEGQHLTWSLPSLSPKLPVLMTSGTTGLPKGARRGTPKPSLAASTALIQQVPYRSGDVIATSSPLFHAWGAAQLMMAGTLGATLVLRQRFVASECIDDIQRHGVNVVATVPIFIQDLLDAPTGVPILRRLRAVSCSGSALPASVASRWLDEVGPSLYNVYGSTEVGQATIAGPSHLRRHPGTVGPTAPGSRVAVLGPDRTSVPALMSGSIFVGSGMGFDGYSDGTTKEQNNGMLATGDTGYFTEDGCLMVTGRDDDMLSTGGENVFPQEIEDVLRRHAEVYDVAVVGLPDPKYGHRLVAVVVPAPAGAETARPGLDQELQDLVRNELASYKTPRTVVFQTSLPTNPAGKVLRGALVTKAQELLGSAEGA